MEGLFQDYQAARLRDKYKDDRLNQSLLAPFEHMDFSRQAVRENPMMALPLAAMPLFYYAAKAPMIRPLSERMGLVNQDATPQDIDQLFGAYRGIGQGLFRR